LKNPAMMEDDALDKRLKQDALTAQRHPPNSVERQKALTRLIHELQRPGVLCRPFKGWFQGLYSEIYAEAKQMLFYHICHEIDQYNPEKKVLQWVNFLLKKRYFVEACREIYPDFKQGNRRAILPSLESLDSFSSDTSPLLSEQVLECLSEDPEGVFQTTYTQKPEANFQYLAQQIAAGYKWRELSEELGLEISSLSSFYYRCLKKFSPIFRKYIMFHRN
jgi:hypothetical protein